MFIHGVGFTWVISVSFGSHSNTLFAQFMGSVLLYASHFVLIRRLPLQVKVSFLATIQQRKTVERTVAFSFPCICLEAFPLPIVFTP